MKFKKMFTTTDLHVAGEPLRIITSGLPEIPGDTQLEKEHTAWSIWITCEKY